MLKVSFMYDNHTFASIKTWDSAADLFQKASALFHEDGCGMLFVRDHLGGDLKSLTLHGRLLKPRDVATTRARLNSGYGVTYDDLTKWANAVLEEQSFQRLVA